MVADKRQYHVDNPYEALRCQSLMQLRNRLSDGEISAFDLSVHNHVDGSVFHIKEGYGVFCNQFRHDGNKTVLLHHADDCKIRIRGIAFIFFYIHVFHDLNDILIQAFVGLEQQNSFFEQFFDRNYLVAAQRMA